MAIAGLALAFVGCYPDLSGFTVVGANTDAGPRPVQLDRDAGAPIPIDLGTPCGSPHLLIATGGASSGYARLLRYDVSSGALCRQSPSLERQPAFGRGINDVDWSPSTGDLLALEGAILALDAEGFGAWRHEPFQDSRFAPAYVLALPMPAGLRVTAFWSVSSSSTLESGRLLDGTGHLITEEIDMPFSSSGMVAAHPSGDGRLLIAHRGGPISAFTIDDSTTVIRDADGVEIFTGTADMANTFSVGSRNHLDADFETRRLAIIHEQGAFLWTDGGAPPTAPFTCGLCNALLVGVAGPGDEIYGICTSAGSSSRLVVHITRSDCQMIVDGSGLAGLTLRDLTLVREAR